MWKNHNLRVFFQRPYAQESDFLLPLLCKHAKEEIPVFSALMHKNPKKKSVVSVHSCTKIQTVPVILCVHAQKSQLSCVLGARQKQVKQQCRNRTEYRARRDPQQQQQRENNAQTKIIKSPNLKREEKICSKMSFETSVKKNYTIKDVWKGSANQDSKK